MNPDELIKRQVLDDLRKKLSVFPKGTAYEKINDTRICAMIFEQTGWELPRGSHREDYIYKYWRFIVQRK